MADFVNILVQFSVFSDINSCKMIKRKLNIVGLCIFFWNTVKLYLKTWSMLLNRVLKLIILI